MTITTIGIDLAKNVFAVHGVDQNGIHVAHSSTSLAWEFSSHMRPG